MPKFKKGSKKAKTYMARIRPKRKAKTSKQARKFMAKHIRRHIKEYGMTKKQAVAVAYAEARKKGYKVPKKR